ncbi:MAG: hypothetical protein A2W99_10950 [Bacteroidetes bacterium GWF2_33_16]|nr:MAG: hypothetical protein A2X00_04790 [Bacteroidetes bacterium GWE2_32_14]OFY04056.1 MAG: hypothetical protein A2W99_10950 [Bacteroidetes bacterium GWF2_33_16]
MSVLLEFAMFPTDKGASVSEYVSKIILKIKNKGYNYKLTAMGTIVETETLSEALQVIQESYNVLEPFSERVYSSVKFDIRKGKSNCLEQKISSIEAKIGKINT